MSNSFAIPRYIIGALIALALGYAIFATHTLWFGPTFVYTAPKDLSTTTADTVTIEGHAKRASSITINGTAVTQSLQGYFAEEFAVFSGENTFSVAITDKFNHSRVRTIRIIKE